VQRAETLFTASDRAQINQAVAAAELKTSAEIVPAVAGSSGRYDRPEDIVGLWCALAALAGVWFALPKEAIEPGSWGHMSDIAKLGWLIAAVVAGFLIGAVLGSRIGWLRRLFTPRQQMRDEVLLRARQVFFDHRVHHTAGSSGILIYVSLFERMAAVIGDQLVLEKLGQPVLDELCGQLTGHLRTRNPTSAICETVRAAGERLGPVLPRATNDVNELPDALVVID
jgi:putative membrane protein